MKLSPTELFGLAAVFYLLIGTVLTTVFRHYPETTIEIQLHSTYFVTNHPHFCFLFVAIFSFFSVVYFLYRKIAGRKLNHTLSRIHFWVTFIGIPVLAWILAYLYDPSNRYQSNALKEQASTFIFIVIILAQLIFIFNLIYSYIKGGKEKIIS